MSLPGRISLLIGTSSVLFGLAMAATGGPDSAGMEWIDSAESDGPPHLALDIDDEGSDLGLGDEDTASVDLPFDVSWYGSTESQIIVGDNGTAFFSGSQAASSAACPGSGTWQGVAAYWDDLQGGTVRTATLGRTPNRIWVADWQDITPSGASATGQVQIWFQEGRPNEVVVVHEDLSFGSSSYTGGVGASIGIQGSSAGLEWSCVGGLSDSTSAWFGDPSQRPSAATVDLSSEYRQEWSGSSDYSFIGETLAGGDLNSDGLGDVLIGAPQSDTVWLSYGGSSPLDGDVALAQASFTGNSGDLLGTAMAIADLDGDGAPEVILGEPELAGSNAKEGAVHIFSNISFSGDFDAVDADAKLVGPTLTTKPRFGTALAALDFDGDGYLDLAIGSPNVDAGSLGNAGAVRIWSGGSVASGTVNTLDFTGQTANDKLGAVIAGGDADGDGFDDLLLGSTTSDTTDSDAGEAWLVLGSAAWSGSNDIGTSATASFAGDLALDGFGNALLLTDLDGDGLGDLVMGASEESTGGSGAGAAYVFLDGSAWTGANLGSDADWMATGASTNAELGASFSSIDANGDGDVDLIVGAPGVSGSSGAAYVFNGPISAATTTSASADHALQGGVAAGAAGTSVLGLEDHNGDGYGDVAVGAWFAASGAKTLAGVVSIWGWVPSFEDADADGLVSALAGGPDCDDADASIYPSAAEDTALDSGFATDNDCDGWNDGAYWLRTQSDLFDADAIEILGENAGESFDFESATVGSDLSSFYSSNGMELFGTSVTGASSAFGASASGDVCLKVSGTSLTVSFDSDVDGVSFGLLDASGPLTFQAWDGSGASVLSTGGALKLEADGEDVPGGRFVGVLFDSPIQKLRITPTTSDGVGYDDWQVYWSEDSDRDGDGYTGGDGDCDDSDADVNPDATEDLNDGIDNDCDGTVDGGGATAYTDASSWESDAGVTLQEMDFEDLTVGDTVSSDYADLGLDVDSSLDVSTDIDGASPNETQGGEANTTTVTLSFEEVQPAVAFEILDGQGTFTLTGYAHGSALYSNTLTLSENNSSSFRGYVYDYGVDTLEITGPSTDTWGLDDISFAELGLDDADGDGFTEAEGDCDDSDATVYEGATETWYDGVDSDCGGDSDYDADGDGYDSDDDCDDGDSSVSPDAEETYYDGVDSDCDGGSDYDADGDGYDDSSYGGTDCDDSDAAVSPGASEVFYDATDDNCDPTDDFDADGDGYSASGYGSSGSIGTGDCDDAESGTSPGASETWYDGVDADCDGASDYDADEDGYESETYGGTDCDDGDEAVNPGVTDVWYDGLDQDCAGDSDYDADLDGYDHDSYGGLDCDDTDASINPDGTESSTDDGIDEDCDGVDEWDDDLDGFRDVDQGGNDCDDADATIYPGAADTCYDGTDSDCFGNSDYDCDGDGYDSDAYGGLDCDDAAGSVNPGALDYSYDGVDSNCDGLDDYDVDGDGYDVDFYGGLDCDDTDAGISPAAVEIWYDGVDQDCAADSDYDADGDGSESIDYLGDDCDDADATICPTCVDVPDDGIDQDCDGADDLDGDGDGYGSDDCDDTDPDVSPGASEIWYDGVDQDCSGTSDFDADLDGQDSEVWGGQDCDDGDASVRFGGSEIWYDGKDGDCLGGDDYDQDGDGFAIDTWGGTDCVDTDPAIHPDVALDECFGGDQDCDGEVDEDCEAEETGDTGDTGEPLDTSETGDTSEDTGAPSETGEPSDSEPDTQPQDTGEAPEADGCGGCSGSGGAGGLAWLAVLALGALRRRR